MRDKRNESKIKAMLERTGVIRKVDESHDVDLIQTDSDIRPSFNTPDDAVKVTPAARQPIPGMPTPVFPTEKPAEPIREHLKSEEDLEAELARSVEIPMYEEDYEEISEEFASVVTTPDPYAYEPVEHVEPAAPPPAPAAPPPAPVSTYSREPVYEVSSLASSMSMDREVSSENYTDRFLNTDELYDALALRSKKQDTIYLIEEYLQTLPDSLPDSSRRDIVSKLLAASGFDYDLLMGDGVLRVKMLKEYAERFARHTDDYIAARQAELDELDQQIIRTRRLIENRKELHKKQFFSIEAEAQRLKEVLTFISG